MGNFSRRAPSLPDTKKTLVLIVVLAVIIPAVRQLPALGAGGLLHPSRRHVMVPPPAGCEDVTFAGEVALKGWRCPAAATRRATIIYLHGIADNRASSEGVITRFRPRGFEVIAYDSRAHGESEGAACTYGFFEKRDLRRVADTVVSGPIVLIGSSLGAAVALQEAADDPRIGAIVAAEPFSDLRTVATERAPFVFTRALIDRAFSLAEQQGKFEVTAVSPLRAAAQIHVPVLLIHGDADVDTPPDHSRRIFAALAGPKRLLLMPGAHHNESLTEAAWNDVEHWLDQIIR
jgi:hypothetical protein